MNHTRRQSGYVLLLTLVLIALAAVALSRVSRRSLAAVVDAQQVADELQWRWAARSAEIALLPKAKALLEAAEIKSLEPLTAMSVQITLGDQPYTLIVSDEQAKLNVNTLYQRHGRSVTEKTIMDLLRSSRNHGELVLRPMPAFSEQTYDHARAFTSLSQIVPAFDPAHLITPGQASFDQELMQLPFASITCWSTGKVNFRRAAPQVLYAMLTPALTRQQVDELISIRLNQPGVGLARALELLELKSHAQREAEQRLTDDSQSQSLWLIARQAHRNRAALIVRMQSTNLQTMRFFW